ncbi:MAG TPA: hypothetical protein PK351_12535 [Spirochaetota bacterium]|nr:hypothetical protein [Spirochaetota bacterium]
MKEIIINALKECEKHTEMLKWQINNLNSIFPITPEKLKEIDITTKSFIDSTIFRFAKLQDTISQRIFKNILILLEEDIENYSFLDILNKLEKLTIIPSAEKWIELRKIRNTIVHEYETNFDLIAEELNLFYNYIPILLEIYEKLKDYLDKKLNIKL